MSKVLPSVLWHCWLVVRKSIWPVKKKWVMRCWRGYLSGARCKWFAHGPADATATPSSLASLKSKLVQPFWYWLTRLVLEKAIKGVSVTYPRFNDLLSQVHAVTNFKLIRNCSRLTILNWLLRNLVIESANFIVSRALTITLFKGATTGDRGSRPPKFWWTTPTFLMKSVITVM